MQYWDDYYNERYGKLQMPARPSAEAEKRAKGSKIWETIGSVAQPLGTVAGGLIGLGLGGPMGMMAGGAVGGGLGAAAGSAAQGQAGGGGGGGGGQGVSASDRFGMGSSIGGGIGTIGERILGGVVDSQREEYDEQTLRREAALQAYLAALGGGGY